MGQTMIEEKKIEIVGNTIKKMDYPTPTKLFTALKRFFTKSEFETILGFLLLNRYILMDKGEIVWVHGGEIVDEILSDKEKWIAV